jgi:hypothetical protein
MRRLAFLSFAAPANALDLRVAPDEPAETPKRCSPTS